jgi:hypothetical protein
MPVSAQAMLFPIWLSLAGVQFLPHPVDLPQQGLHSSLFRLG